MKLVFILLFSSIAVKCVTGPRTAAGEIAAERSLRERGKLPTLPTSFPRQDVPQYQQALFEAVEVLSKTIQVKRANKQPYENKDVLATGQAHGSPHPLDVVIVGDPKTSDMVIVTDPWAEVMLDTGATVTFPDGGKYRVLNVDRDHPFRETLRIHLPNSTEGLTNTHVAILTIGRKIDQVYPLLT